MAGQPVAARLNRLVVLARLYYASADKQGHAPRRRFLAKDVQAIARRACNGQDLTARAGHGRAAIRKSSRVEEDYVSLARSS